MLGREHALGHPALTDTATGMANRLHFELVYSYLFHGADRGVPMALMLISVGSDEELPVESLRELGEIFQNVSRVADLSAHLGHGRFGVLLLGTNLMGGRVAADRFMDNLAGHTPGPVAVGLAGYTPDMKEPGQLLEAADAALQRAQQGGGGVELAQQ